MLLLLRVIVLLGSVRAATAQRILLSNTEGDCTIENVGGSIQTSCGTGPPSTLGGSDSATHEDIIKLQDAVNTLLRHFNYMPPPAPPPGPPPASPGKLVGAWKEIGLKLECTNGGTTHTLEWTNLQASAAALLVSPTPEVWTCQGKGSHTANTGCKNYNVRRPHMRTSAL